jgi:hypothetical protein
LSGCANFLATLVRAALRLADAGCTVAEFVRILVVAHHRRLTSHEASYSLF